MASIEKRLAALEAKRSQSLGKDAKDMTDEELWKIIGDGDGYSLALLPGDSRDEKLDALDAALKGDLVLSPKVRHSVRGWFEVSGKD